LRYECPRCGNVSSEGLAVGPGPECLKCGTEMLLVRRGKEPGAARKRPSPTPQDPAPI
jgi:DNA-directed RNA polymerase subunit RPC12/RpoP